MRTFLSPKTNSTPMWTMSCRRSAAPMWRRGFLTHPDDAERVQAWRTMAAALHTRYDSVADETIPQRLEIDRLVRRPPRSDGRRDRSDPRGVRRRWRRGMACPWRGHRVSCVPEFHGGCTGSSSPLRGRDPSPRRGARQRTGASAAMADQTLRLVRSSAGARRNRIEAGRRPAIARTHGASVIPDV